jgi:hypothetical protein
MEMVMMNKTNDTSTLDHRPLADSELDAVTGGWLPTGIPGSGTPAAAETAWKNGMAYFSRPLKSPEY